MSNPNRTRFGIDFDYFDISKTILDKILLQQPILYFVTKSSPKNILSSLFIQWSTDRNFRFQTVRYELILEPNRARTDKNISNRGPRAGQMKISNQFKMCCLQTSGSWIPETYKYWFLYNYWLLGWSEDVLKIKLGLSFV